jgi:hypothetical protein
LVLIDGYNVDPKPLVAELCGEYDCVVVRDEKSWREARPAAQGARKRNVWYLRATHDVSPGRLNDRLQEAWAASHVSRIHRFLPYSALERFVLRTIGRENPSTHFYQMLEMHRR